MDMSLNVPIKTTALEEFPDYLATFGEHELEIASFARILQGF